MYGTCRQGGGGLGQTETQVLSARDILLSMITNSLARLAPYGKTQEPARIRAKIAEAEQWFKGGLSRFYELGNNADALRSFTNGITIMHQVVPMIAQLSPADIKAAGAERYSRTMSSVPLQIENTVASAITAPLAAAVESISPAAAEVIRSSNLLLPIGAGLALLFLLKR